MSRIIAPPGFVPVDKDQQKRRAIPTTATGVDGDVQGLVQEPRPEGFTKDVTPPEPPSELEQFGQRVADITKKRVEKVQRGTEMLEAGEISQAESMMRGVGFAVGLPLEIMGEGLMTVLSKLTPDAAEDYLKELIAAGGSKIADTETAKRALDFYGNLSPRARDNIGDIFDISMAAIPAYRGKFDPGTAISKSGVEAEKRILGQYVLNQSDSVKQARAKEIGMPKNLQRVANSEEEVLNTILSLKGVSSSSSREKVMDAINSELSRLTRDIETALMGSKELVSKPALIKAVTDGVQQTMKAKPIYNSKAFKDSRRKVQEAFTTAFKEFSGQPKDLIKLRQEFDANIATLFKGDVHEGNHAIRELVASVRNQLNQTAQSAVETAGGSADILAKLRRQHNLLRGKEDLSYNMATQNTNLQRLTEAVNSHPYMAMSAASGTGIAGSVLQSEAGMLAGAGLGVLYGATRPVTRKAIGATLASPMTTRGMLYGATSDENDLTVSP